VSVRQLTNGIYVVRQLPAKKHSSATVLDWWTKDGMVFAQNLSTGEIYSATVKTAEANWNALVQESQYLQKRSDVAVNVIKNNPDDYIAQKVQFVQDFYDYVLKPAKEWEAQDHQRPIQIALS